MHVVRDSQPLFLFLSSRILSLKKFFRRILIFFGEKTHVAFFFILPPNESVLRKKHITENHAQNKNMLDINLLRPEKGGDPVRFVATTFIPLSLLVVFVDVFLCSSSFRRRLRRAMMIGDDF